MELELIIGWIGFLMAAYSVMGNDAPAQVLGTLISSHPDKKWILWLGSAALLCAALVFSWMNYNHGIAFDRLDKIEPVTMEWYYLMGPVALLILTRLGVPVSTSFMMLAMFSAGIVLEKIIIKSMVGYGLAMVVAFSVWIIISKIQLQQGPANMKFWRPLQYLTTGTLWWFWLSHDMANIAVFLPRQFSLTELIAACVILSAMLGLIFRESGGKVHKFVFRDESDDMDIRVATLIDAIYALLLFVFKEWNNLPMSTTWVFVGLMAGREMGKAVWNQSMSIAFKMVAIRLGVLTFGAVVSLGMVGLVLVLK